MRTIVFIETNKSGSSREAIRSAERLGYYTVLYTNKRNFLKQREEFPDVHEMIFSSQLTESELTCHLDRLIQQGKIISGVISFIDPYVTVATKLSYLFEIEGFTLSAIEIMEDKIRTREALKETNMGVNYEVYTPDLELDDFIKNLKIRYPCIVKSPSSTGSKDVYLINHKEELSKEISSLIKKYKFQPILIEEYIDGSQWLIEAMVVNGELEIVAIIEQEISNTGKFIITGYYSVLELDPFLFSSLKDSLTTIVSKIGFEKGACHFELRYCRDEWKLIEINPRISGGAMNSMIYHSLGINLVEETLKMYLGLPFQLQPSKKQYVYTHYLTIGTKGRVVKITGKSRASQFEGVKEVYIKPRKGMMVYPPTSMGHRYGYLIVEAESKERAKQLALIAAREIKFYIEEQE